MTWLQRSIPSCTFTVIHQLKWEYKWVKTCELAEIRILGGRLTIRLPLSHSSRSMWHSRFLLIALFSQVWALGKEDQRYFWKDVLYTPQWHSWITETCGSRSAVLSYWRVYSSLSHASSHAGFNQHQEHQSSSDSDVHTTHCWRVSIKQTLFNLFDNYVTWCIMVIIYISFLL